MRITAFIYGLGAGGAERVLTLLAAAWARRGHQVTLVTYDAGTDAFFEPVPEVAVRTLCLSGGSLGRRVGNHLRRIPAFRRVIRETRPAVVVSFMDRTNVLVLAASRALKVPVVVSERIDPHDPYDRPGLVSRLLRRVLYPSAAALVVQNEGQARWFRGFSRNVRTIPNPVRIPEEEPDFRHRTLTIVAAGRLTKQKGFDLLLEAFAGAVVHQPGWELVILGEGPARGALTELGERLGLAGKVRLPGVTSELSRHLESAGIFVLSSRFEGFPNVLLEALAAACPVVASACNDAVEQVVTDEWNGLLVPAGEPSELACALERMMREPDLRRRLAARARRSVRTYDAEEISERWLNLLLESQ